MKFAELTPTTAELQERHPLDPIAELVIAERRAAFGYVARHPESGTLGLSGPCAPDEMGVGRLQTEAEEIYDLEQQQSGLVTAQRRPTWKPRTNLDSWWGHETTDPEGAYSALTTQANTVGNAAIELGHVPHVQRYGDRIVFGWIGARTDNRELKIAIAMADPSLPLGVKNGLDGDITGALDDIKAIEDARGEDGAPALLVYRGGTGAADPQAWEYGYMTALEATEGRMIVDPAHGGEMAHDPDGRFAKSVLGQQACLEHVIQIAERHGMAPAGIMLEASDTHSQVDPVIPHALALDGIVRLHQQKMSLVGASR